MKKRRREEGGGGKSMIYPSLSCREGRHKSAKLSLFNWQSLLSKRHLITRKEGAGGPS